MDVLHRIVDRETCRDGTARGVDVEGDWFGGVLGFEEEELGDDGGGAGFFYFAVEADDSFFEEAGEDVVFTFRLAPVIICLDLCYYHVHVCQPPPTVSVTKGIGKAELGGFCGVAL